MDPHCIRDNTVREEEIVDPRLPDERYIAITVSKAAYIVDSTDLNANAMIDKEEVDKIIAAGKVVDELRFVPYYYRANRGGRGMARVGLKQWAV